MIELPSDQKDALTVAEALSRFDAAPELRTMRDWLKSELTHMDARNRDEPDEKLFRQRQGAGQVVAKLLELAGTADKTAEQIRASLARTKGA